MTRLPQAERAVLDVSKLEDYCLDPAHLHGRHKARVFRDALGIGKADAPWLRQILLGGVCHHDAVELATDDYGTRWRVDIPAARLDRHIVVRTIWIIRTGERVPRFVTCWVL